MEKRVIMRIAIIGFGNVGFHLAKILIEKGEALEYVYNRSPMEAPGFLQDRGLDISHTLQDIPDTTELCLIAVKDDVIQSVSNLLPNSIKKNCIVAHTSGIHDAEIMDDAIRNKAVFYPLNSFSKSTAVNWTETPVFINAQTANEQELKALATKISQQIYMVDNRQKMIIHATAVIVNNFPNALFQMASRILEDHQLDIKPLLPLIETTAQKVKEMHPRQAQTGPAKRGDRATLEKHLALLDEYPFEKQIYQLLSHYINPELKNYEDD